MKRGTKKETRKKDVRQMKRGSRKEIEKGRVCHLCRRLPHQKSFAEN